MGLFGSKSKTTKEQLIIAQKVNKDNGNSVEITGKKIYKNGDVLEIEISEYYDISEKDKDYHLRLTLKNKKGKEIKKFFNDHRYTNHDDNEYSGREGLFIVSKDFAKFVLDSYDHNKRTNKKNILFDKDLMSLKVAEELNNRKVLSSVKMENESQKTKTLLADKIASDLHEDWRKTRLKEDGSYDPRWKKIKDEQFISKLNNNKLPSNIRLNEEGAYEIDIANTSYENLSADWQEENKKAGEVVATIILREEETEKKYSEGKIGAIIHDAWLARNDWAKGGELDVPFDKLPKNEQDKDLVQYQIGR
ncbi:MAG: hypothetical protein KBT30_01460, partial [Clostridiales bacterium]|nr:hypothetical protein [Candidatus Apopatousia equi]